MHAKILLMTAVLLSSQVYAQATPSDTPDTPVVVVKKKKKKKKPAAANTAAATTEVAAPAVAAPVVEVKKAEVKAAEPAKPDTFLQYMKDHFSASYHGEYYFVRRDAESDNPEDRKIQDFNVFHNPTIIYKPTPNWQVLATGEFKYTDVPGGVGGDGTYINNYYRALLTVTRKNILIEKESGVQLDVGVGRRDFNSVGPFKNNWGNDRIFTTITKNYGKNNISLFAEYLYNDPKKSSSTTWKHGIELIPTINYQVTEKLTYTFNDTIDINTPKFETDNSFSLTHDMNLMYWNYQWNDKLSTYYQFKYEHAQGFSNTYIPLKYKPTDDYFQHAAGVAYAFSPKFTLTGEINADVAHAGDGRSLFAKKASYPEFTIYIDASI